MSSSQEEVSDPEERAETHYGNLDVNNYERMVAFSRANQFRLRSVLESLRMRRNIAEVDGNWEEASNYSVRWPKSKLSLTLPSCCGDAGQSGAQ